MNKLEKLKEYFMINNIRWLSSCQSTYKNGKEKYTLSFYTDIQDFNAFNKTFIVCLKNENTSYFIPVLDKTHHYQKLGDYNKGVEIIEEIELYYHSEKYSNAPEHFLDQHKQIFFEKGRENIKKYENFWENKFFEYPEYSDVILTRLSKNKQRKLKLKKLDGKR